MGSTLGVTSTDAIYTQLAVNPQGRFDNTEINQVLANQYLFALKGLNAATVYSNYCEYARNNKLDCLELVSDWDLFLRLRQQAVSKLKLKDDSKIDITIDKVQGGQVFYYYAGEYFVTPEAEFKAHWVNKYTLFWDAPWGYQGPIQPGSSDYSLPQIRHMFLKWVEREASAQSEKITGDDFENMSSLDYDAGFASVVTLFQQRNNLVDDGVIRPHVLILLENWIQNLKSVNQLNDF